MPEMPEVEIIRRIIEPQIAGEKVLSVIVNHPQIIAYPEIDEFVAMLSGQVFHNMSRRGKFLTFHFENGDRMVLHLKMTGQLLVTPADYPEEKHTHLVVSLSGGNQIRYIDVRRFGRFWYLKKEEVDIVTGQDKLGLEPFDKDFTAEYLKTKIGKRKKSIKEMLHDQSIIAGIGNIYSDEILSEAGIYPEEKCMDLDDADWEKLTEKIKEIIAWGIDINEMTPEEYLAGKGKEYSNISSLRVYGLEGKPCKKCNNIIERIVIGGRSSCFCPSCQKKKKKKVAFICVHNSCRSQIAEALGKMYGSNQYDFYSAGTETKPQINQDAVRLMKDLYGIDMEKKQYSKLLSDIPSIDIVITMGCNVQCPFLPCERREDWGLDDPTGKDDDEFIKTIRIIEEKVKLLLERE